MAPQQTKRRSRSAAGRRRAWRWRPVYLIVLLRVEKQTIIIALLAVGIARRARGELARAGSTRSAAASANARMRSARSAIVAALAVGVLLPRGPFRAAAGLHGAALHRRDARAEHPVRLCRRAQFRRRLVLRHRRLYGRGAQPAHGHSASARAADRRADGGADRLAAAAAGACARAGTTPPSSPSRSRCCSRPSSRSTTCSAARRACRSGA